MPHPLNSSNWEEDSFPPNAHYRRITQLFENLANEVNDELASLQKQLNRERCLNQRLQLTKGVCVHFPFFPFFYHC